MSTNARATTTSASERAASHGAAPDVGVVDFGDLGRDEPISRKFGEDRGPCLDRYYIERFLLAHAADVRGRVLEVADNAYTKKFGDDRVTQSDVLHAVPDNRRATIVGDLTRPGDLPVEAFDCVILTQTLQHVFDAAGALSSVRRTLRPGGVLLCTVPGISQISRYDMDRWGDYWRFTTLSLRRLSEAAFPHDHHEVRTWGNVRVATAFLHGLCVDDVGADHLLRVDEDYQVLLTLRVRKSEFSK